MVIIELSKEEQALKDKVLNFVFFYDIKPSSVLRVLSYLISVYQKKEEIFILKRNHKNKQSKLI